MSAIKQKILLLLLGGLAFGYSYTPRRRWKVMKEIAQSWRDIDREKLREEIKNLYKSKLVTKKENPDGTITIILTDRGKLRALTYKFENMKIEKRDWDGKWRFVVFDVPERIRQGRDALREKLKQLGFYELQKSVFVFPYDCKNEIDFLIEFFELRKYVRSGVMELIDNDLHLRQIFSLG